jgi:hypothetical protein
MKMKYGVALLLAALLAPFSGIARAFSPQGRDALNTTGSHDGADVTRISEEAIGTANLLVTKGTADRQVLICSATTRPLGTAYDAVAITTDVGVCLLGGGATRVMVASEAIAVDSAVYTTASGKVSDNPTNGCWLVGYALTAASGDGKELEVQTCVPTRQHLTTSTTHSGSTGSVAVPITHRSVKLTTTGAHTATLADGLFVGQRLTIICVAYSGGAATLTPTTGLEWSTFVFAVKGQRIDLEWTASGWIISGFCYLTTLPVLTVP